MSPAPVKQEHALVVTARGLAAQAVQSDLVKRALDAAKAARGRIIASESDATMNADTAKLLAEGLKAIKAAKAGVLEIPKAMTAVVNEVCKPIEQALTEGKQACDSAALAYRAQLAAAQREAVARQQREAAALAEQAARDRAQFGTADEEEEVVALEAPVAAAPAPTMVRGSSGGQVFSEILVCEMVNPHECDPAWLELRTKDALDWFREQMKRGDVEKPGDATHPIQERGVRFWYKPSVSTR